MFCGCGLNRGARGKSKKQRREEEVKPQNKRRKMKRLSIVLALGLMAMVPVRAQDKGADGSREAKRAEMIQKSGERMAKNFGLEGAARDSFLAVYTRYQTEMFATNAPRARKPEGQARDGEGKQELTDEQATARIEAQFERQEQQVRQIRQRLDIQRRYYARFQNMLTPAQTLKAMFPQRPRPQGSAQRQGGGNRRGGGDGPGGPGGFGGFGGPGGF